LTIADAATAVKQRNLVIYGGWFRPSHRLHRQAAGRCSSCLPSES